jgi:hypothetical protein
MKAVVTYVLQGTVCEDEHFGDRITGRILRQRRGERGNRGWVNVDGYMTLYRRVERIAFLRGGREDA